MNILERANEAVEQHKAKTGKFPTEIYLGQQEKREFILWCVENNEQWYNCNAHRIHHNLKGLNLHILDDESHFNVAMKII